MRKRRKRRRRRERRKRKEKKEREGDKEEKKKERKKKNQTEKLFNPSGHPTSPREIQVAGKREEEEKEKEKKKKKKERKKKKKKKSNRKVIQPIRAPNFTSRNAGSFMVSRANHVWRTSRNGFHMTL